MDFYGLTTNSGTAYGYSIHPSTTSNSSEGDSRIEVAIDSPNLNRDSHIVQALQQAGLVEFLVSLHPLHHKIGCNPYLR